MEVQYADLTYQNNVSLRHGGLEFEKLLGAVIPSCGALGRDRHDFSSGSQRVFDVSEEEKS